MQYADQKKFKHNKDQLIQIYIWDLLKTKPGNLTLNFV